MASTLSFNNKNYVSTKPCVFKGSEVVRMSGCFCTFVNVQPAGTATRSHAGGFLCSRSDPTGYTVIIGQPKSNPGADGPEGPSQPAPVPLPMPMPPAEAQSPSPAGPAGEENPGGTLPESK